MTRPRYIREPGGSYAISLGLFALGGAALALTIGMNFMFGETLALSDFGKKFQSFSSVVVDVGAFLFVLVGGCLVANKRRALGTIVSILALPFLVFSTANLVGFGLSERVAAHDQRAHALAASETAAKDQRQARTDHVKWLKVTVTETKQSGRQPLLAEIDAQIGKLGKPAETPKTLKADAQATVLAKKLGWSVEDVQTSAVTWLAILLIAAKGLGAWLAPMMWPKYRLAEADDATASETVSDVPRLSVVVSRQSDGLASASSDGLAAVESSMRPADREAAEPRSLVDERRKRQVRAFFADAMVQTGSGRVTAGDVHAAYQAWAREMGVEPMTVTLFGRVCTDIGIAKSNNGSRIYYLGYEIAAAAEVPARIAA